MRPSFSQAGWALDEPAIASDQPRVLGSKFEGPAGRFLVTSNGELYMVGM